MERDNDGEAEYEAKIADTARPRPGDYMRRINRAVYQQGDLSRALQLFQEMKTVELVKPNPGHFRVLIHACGKAGYTKKVTYYVLKFESNMK